MSRPILTFLAVLFCLVALDVQRRFSGTDVEAKKRLEAVQYLSAKLEPIMPNMTEAQREILQLRLSNLDKVAKDPASLSVGQQRYYGEALERLMRVHSAHRFISDGRTDACEAENATIPADEHSFTHAEFPGYTDPNTSVLRMVDDEQTLVQRRQLSGLCYMHAPAVVQYYAIWQAALKAGNATPGHGMLDLTHDIASNFSPLKLAHHVLDDDGGSSFDYLNGILQPGSKIKALEVENDHRSHLLEYGPGLVSGFKVYSDFLVKDVHKHQQPQANSTYIGLHAMVLVGARVDSSGNHSYLLQNWWSGKQFVEVSQEYLAFCSQPQIIYYVGTPQTGVPKGRHTHAAGMHFAETEAVLEKGERLPMEMEMGRSPVHPSLHAQLV